MVSRHTVWSPTCSRPCTAGVIGLLAAALAAAGAQLPRVPRIVGESVAPLSVSDMDRWTPGAGLDVAAIPLRGRPTPGAELTYQLDDKGTAEAQVTLPQDRLPGERIRFWLQGDGSGNRLRLSCNRAGRADWVQLSDIALDFTDRRHLEIPASNPIHRFHKGTDRLRLVVAGGNGATQRSGRLLLHGLELVSPVAVAAPLAPATAPIPVFDTWGGASKDHIRAGADMGTTLHLAPVHFFNRPTAAGRVDYAAKAIDWCADAGLMVGLAFYNHPGNDWLAQHPDLLVQAGDGRRYDGAGAFTSPWHPEGRQRWRDHIIACLTQLKRAGKLDRVDVIELCPGEEGEVSYQWDRVWAWDPHARAAYTDYVKRLYADRIDELNRDWGTTHAAFDEITPPSDYYPDRAHWVFTDFYRLSMLRYCVFLADAVSEVFTPSHWLWMTHSLGSYPGRFHAGRHPLFYAENLRRLGYLDYAQMAALNWQARDDVLYLQHRGIRVIAEVDVIPTAERMSWTFGQCRTFGMDGVFIGILEQHSVDGRLTPIGKTTKALIGGFKAQGTMTGATDIQ